MQIAAKLYVLSGVIKRTAILNTVRNGFGDAFHCRAVVFVRVFSARDNFGAFGFHGLFVVQVTL